MKQLLLYSVISVFFGANGFAQKPQLNNHRMSSNGGSITETNTRIAIETPDATLLRGELKGVDMEEGHVIMGNSSDSTTIRFENVYKVYEGDFNGATGYHYRIDAPQRFFYTPMGNTIPKGMVSLENYFFVNNQIKVGILDNLEAGIGITLYPVENNEDTSVSVLPMGSIKYKFINRRHLKASVGAVSAQLPQVLAIQNVQFGRRAWFNVVFASADWEYKFGTFSFSVAQPYLNLFPLKNASAITATNEGLDYMFSASYSVKVFPFAHFVSENVFFSGAWNAPGRPNTINRETLLMPLVGGRYYGEYYSFAGGFSNILIPNAVVFFYLGGTYFFE